VFGVSFLHRKNLLCWMHQYPPIKNGMVWVLCVSLWISDVDFFTDSFCELHCYTSSFLVFEWIINLFFHPIHSETKQWLYEWIVHSADLFKNTLIQELNKWLSLWVDHRIIYSWLVQKHRFVRERKQVNYYKW